MANKNPFTPAIGRIPNHIAGRADILTDIDAVLEGDGSDPAVISLFVGARGSGKTALLSYYANAAEANGWIAARVTCSASVLDDVIIQIHRSAKHLMDAKPPRKVKAASIARIG